MVKLTNGALTTAAVLSLLGSVQAAPSGDIAIKSLVKRANNFEDCDTDQRKKAGQALADATVLARWTFDHQYKDHPYQDTDAYVIASEPFDNSCQCFIFTCSLSEGYRRSPHDRFKHYFEPDDYTRHVRTMFDLIQQNNDPTNPPYQFIVTCKDAPVCGGKDGSLAVTDALPRSKTFMPRIRLCPKFFNPNTLETKYDLGSRDFKKNPGRRDNSWCQPGKPFSFFETAGHTILHEMTHLDEIASMFPLPQFLTCTTSSYHHRHCSY